MRAQTKIQKQSQKRSKASTPHETGLLKDLKDKDVVVGYLNSILNAVSEDQSIDPFLAALNQIAKVHGVQKIATRSKRTRDAIYKALSSQGNPTFYTLIGILEAMGLQLQVQKKRP